MKNPVFRMFSNSFHVLQRSRFIYIFNETTLTQSYTRALLIINFIISVILNYSDHVVTLLRCCVGCLVSNARDILQTNKNQNICT